MSELSDLIAQHCPDNLTQTAIPHLILSRSATKTQASSAMYYPLLCVLARGRKKVFLGGQELSYDPDSYLISSTDLPVSGQVVEAPYLGLTLALQSAVLAELLLQMPLAAGAGKVSQALTVNPIETNLLSALVRLLRLLNQTVDIPVMAPLVQREIHYILLQGPQGGMLRQMVLPGSDLGQVRRAIHLIRERFDQRLSIHDLAQETGMSHSSLHRHFRAVTGMSPLQFQKCLRLQEARRKLFAQTVPAGQVSSEVGYESASQFSREYRRSFGVSPAQDAAQARRAMMKA